MCWGGGAIHHRRKSETKTKNEEAEKEIERVEEKEGRSLGQGDPLSLVPVAPRL